MTTLFNYYVGFAVLIQICIGLMWQGFVRGEATEVASVSRFQKLSQVNYETVPASSKRDPPLSRGKPISDTGCAFVTGDLRKEQTGMQQLGKRSEKMIREPALQSV